MAWRRVGRCVAGAAAIAGALVAPGGCASTEFVNEGPGQPSDRASGTVPPGAIGVCKRPFTKRPPIVNPELWEHARPCNLRTPAGTIRLGYGRGLVEGDPQADAQEERILGVVREAPRGDAGNSKLVAMVRSIREQAIKNAELRDRVARETARAAACDFTYMLNTMQREREALEPGNRCAVLAYDAKARGEVCLFDVTSPEAVWLTSAWDCVSQTNETGEAQSCHRLCSYDDYCSVQVSCAAPDLDLLLCVLGVCVPEPRAGF